MTDREALYKAVTEDWDDITLRLVLADHLEEYATSDRDIARAEWIRTFHTKNRAKGKPTEFYRMPGEVDWMWKNAHRLWPSLFAAAEDPHRVTPRKGETRVEMKFLERCVSLRIPLVQKRHKRGRTETWSAGHWVDIMCHKGVTEKIFIPLRVAGKLAPIAVMDDPHARIQLPSIIQVVTSSDTPPGPFSVCFKPHIFDNWGLRGVKVKLPSGSMMFHEAVPLCSNALTEWAREEAQLRREVSNGSQS